MNESKGGTGDLIRFLQEREKELNCLYKIEGFLQDPETPIEDVCKAIIEAIPPGWQYPDVCQAKIHILESEYMSPNFVDTPWFQKADIISQDRIIGEMRVYYTEEMPRADDGPFLKEETKLLRTIADRLGSFITYKAMNRAFREYQIARKEITEHKGEEWRVVLNLLKNTDKNLYYGISQKMLNHLSWSGIESAEKLRAEISARNTAPGEEISEDENRPTSIPVLNLSDEACDEIFEIAATHLRTDHILSHIQKWMQEDKLGFLIQVVNRNLSVADVADSVRRFRHMAPDNMEIPSTTRKGIEVALIRRFLTSQLQYVNTAKEFIDISDFFDIIDRIIYTKDSQGKLGGKSAGLFLAEKIIRKSPEFAAIQNKIKVPETWYITSDVFLGFLNYNNLNEVFEQKYKDINQVRLEYPHIVQSFKSCRFPPEIIQGLSVILDRFADKPIIVRSSSLLEDRMGAAFSGKYKSLFLANIGSKEERLQDLTVAIAEVYASVFGPDPIEYRAERGMIDFGEEMGIMIQEVVGTRVGDYYLPTFAGVAFSKNEFRWSPRIKREDGLVRMVPGLGTRAVDRVSNDYPALFAPGSPGLRVNVTPDEVVRYSPGMIDVVNLKKRSFETVKVKDLISRYGDKIPGIEKVVSVYDGHSINRPIGLNIDFKTDDLVVTFDSLLGDQSFARHMHDLLKLLESKLETPVDIEFAHDGRNFYLLQCRPQSSSGDSTPSPIPKDIPEERIIFTANKYVSNGRVPDITHLIYVDPQSYSELQDRSELLSVGRAVGRLNKLLPKRQFILMGPGRWGSRGDIRLGVSVTYSDINNTSLLIEIARRKGNYVPELSFGTHFFQDLVEASIRYLPLYPDDQGIIFNQNFLKRCKNILADLLPEFENLSDTVRLIDIPGSSNGNILRVMFNSDLDEAIGYLTEPASDMNIPETQAALSDQQSDNYWAWRFRMAEHIASRLDPNRFGVKGLYIFGSTKNATAGPGSDIDLLLHFGGTESQKKDLTSWLEGWSLSLAEMNYLRTGYMSDGLLDVHFVTDDDIKKKTSYAAKIGAVTDPARPLKMMNEN